jgi:O-antigen/teichoic acid export membrane protein
LTSLGTQEIGHLAPATTRRGRVTRILRTVLTFSAGQMCLQGLTALTGLCLVRWLSVSDYAQFGFSLTFQQALGLIVDLGVTSAIVALVGDQQRNPAVLGRYMRAGFYLRTRLLVIVSVIGAIIFAYLAARQSWPLTRQTAVFGIVVLGLMAQFWSSIYGVPLILRQRLGTYYGIQAGAALLRLFLILVLQLTNTLGAVSALTVGALAYMCTALLFKRTSAQYWALAATRDSEATRRIIGYITPLAPTIVLMSLQGQLVVLILSYFGVAKPIAEVAALGRLGQLFILLSAFNGIVLGPRFARVDFSRLTRQYLGSVGLTAIVSGAAVAAILMCPSALLWVLGPKYATLSHPLQYVAVNGGLTYICSALWSIHSARQWIYWGGTWAQVGVVIVVQASGITFLDVSTTLGASKLSCFTTAGILSVNIAVGVYSFNKLGKSRTISEPSYLGTSPAIQATGKAAG